MVCLLQGTSHCLLCRNTLYIQKYTVRSAIPRVYIRNDDDAVMVGYVCFFTEGKKDELFFCCCDDEIKMARKKQNENPVGCTRHRGR